MPFPLQSIPDSALKHIFRCMTPLELLAISVLSTKLSGLVKSLKIRANRLDITLEKNVTIEEVFQNGRLVFSFPNAGPNGLDEKPLDIQISDYFDFVDSVWTDPRIKLRTFLECILKNFEWYWDGIQLCFWTEHEILNTETLSKCFVSVTDTIIGHPCSAEYAEKIQKYFGPVTKNMDIYDDLFRQHSSSFVQSLAISNYDKLHFPDIRHGTLENLLTFNAESIQICRPSFTQIVVNRFIKLWMKGCNSRLKIFDIEFSMKNEIYDQNVVLKGIKYKEIREEVERQFVGWPRRRQVIKGGYDIKNRNGRRATVHMNQMGIELRILLLVWD